VKRDGLWKWMERMLSMRIFPIHLWAFIWMRESMR
jgi:Predicted membrane protein